MDELTAPQQNRLFAGLSNLLRRVEQDSGPEFLPRGLDVMGLVRQLALPSAETVEKLSYGDPLFRMPTQSNIPITTDRGYLAEVLGLVPAASAASRATTRLSNEAADALVRQITGNQQATAQGALQAAGEMSPLARITGYHGSPHGPISQFDFEKVGSGAGTTNFGYGTYIAEHPAIAGMFRKGRTPSSDNPDGFLYQVDIPDEIIPKMLNWYEEVPEGVRKNLSEKAAQKFGTGLTGTTGEKLYKDLAFSFKMGGSKNPEKDASKWLAEQGVPGIQYENLQMVRGMGRDTNNYVLFEPEKIKIEKINEENAQDFLSARGLLEPQIGVSDQTKRFMEMAEKGSLKMAKDPSTELRDLKEGKSKFAELSLNWDDPKTYDLVDEYAKDGFKTKVIDRGGRNVTYLYKNEKDIEGILNATTPADYGRAYGYSDEDIARFYFERGLGPRDFFEDMGSKNSLSGLLEPQAGAKTSSFEMPSFARLQPETSEDIDKIYDYLEERAKKAGYKIESGSSNVSGSRYLTIFEELPNDDLRSIELRVSNHGDRYPVSYADERLSIDPSVGGVDLEDALYQLQEKGFNLMKD